jgi:iron-sulfur cluster protein
MSVHKKVLQDYYAGLMESARDANLELGLSRSIKAYRERRARTLKRFPHTIEMAKEVRRIKEDCAGRREELVKTAMTNLAGNGAKVYLADTVDDALKIIDGLVGSGKIVVSAKTLTGEEVELRERLEEKGNEVWETDIGQFIQQLRKEKPMHYVLPSLHVSKEEVAKLLTSFLEREVKADIPTEVKAIREFLRDKYFKADVGLSGGNVVAADTGTIVLIENEGNIRMSTNVPPVHIALIGIDKIVPTLEDALKVAEVTWRYAGFAVPFYLNLISAPSGTADIENTLVYGSSGPLELHVIFLDNGRSALAKDPLLKEATYCIKCGGCLLECPIFQLAAGKYGGRSYFGGVGTILSAYIADDFSTAAGIAYSCARCGRCVEECPMSIDTPKLIAELRHRILIKSKGGKVHDKKASDRPYT